MNYNFSGVDAPKNEKDVYGLRYAEFVVPLTKAVQELSVENNNLKEENKQLKEEMNLLYARVTAIEVAQKQNSKSLLQSQTKTSRLEQNTPNPFNNSTIIRYSIIQNTNNAQIVITDVGGVIVKTISVANNGVGQITIEAGTLAAGNYIYTLVIDGREIDSKQMALTK